MSESAEPKADKPNRKRPWRTIGVLTACGLLIAGGVSWINLAGTTNSAEERAGWRQEWFTRGAQMVLTEESRGTEKQVRDVRLMKLANDETLERDLEGIMMQPKLEGLVLKGAKVDQSVVDRLRKHPSLKLLILDDTSVPQESVQKTDSSLEIHFINSSFFEQLTDLQIRRRRPFSRVGYLISRFPELGKEMTALSGWEIIERVDMQNVVVERSVIESLSEVDQLDYLRVGYGFDDEMAKLLPSFEDLTRLDLSQSMVTDSGVEALLRMPKLRRIVLGPNMTDETMTVLAKSQTIESIDCGFSQVGDDGVAAMQGSSTLTGITLSGRPITGRSMEVLKGYPQLRALGISGCGYLTSSDYLAVYEMKDLRFLSASLSPSIRESFQRRLPELEIRN